MRTGYNLILPVPLALFLTTAAAAIATAELPAVTTPPAPATATNSLNGVDQLYCGVSLSVVTLSRWFDSFFDDPKHTEEEAHARLRLKQSITVSRHRDPAYQTSFGGALVLPRLSRRWKLLINGNDDFFDESELEQERLHDSLSETFDSPTLGLQYILLPRNSLRLDLVGGMRLKNMKPYTGPRLRQRHNFSETLSLEASERLYWYLSDGWRSRTRLDINRQLPHWHLLRQRFAAEWSEKRRAREGMRLTATTFLFEPLDRYHGLSYAWDSVYWTRSTAGWQSTTLSASYRQRLWRRWLVAEVKPFIAWEKSHNWHRNPGILFSLSLIFEDR